MGGDNIKSVCKNMCGCGMDSVGSELGPVAKVFCEYFNKF